MRNSPAGARGSWATYVTAAREAALLSKAELARRIAVDRGTIHRWEAGQQRPEQADVVVRFAGVVDVPGEEALAAAGLRPSAEPPTEPTRDPDPELDLIRNSRLSTERKKALIKYILARRARDERARLEDLEQMIQEP